MVRRINTNTVAGQLKGMKAASASLEPTLPLTERERYFFDIITADRETESWSKHHLTIACQLAVNYAQLEIVNETLAREGLMTVSERGTPVQHPGLTSKASLSSSTLQFVKSLGLSASQKGLASSEQKKRNDADSKARDVIKKISNDDLLA